jgi:hypothetical protein
MLLEKLNANKHHDALVKDAEKAQATSRGSESGGRKAKGQPQEIAYRIVKSISLH